MSAELTPIGTKQWVASEPKPHTFTQYRNEYFGFDGRPAQAVPVKVTNWEYTLTLPNGRTLRCLRTEAGYTSVHLPEDGMQTVAFGPDGAHTSTAGTVQPDSPEYDLLTSAGPHVLRDHPAFRGRRP